jgi:protein-tyrosine kinase
MRLRSSNLGQDRLSSPASVGNQIRRPIGQILAIEPARAEMIAARQVQTGRLFGETAIEMGSASESEVRRAVEEQLGYPVLVEGDGRINPLVVAAFVPDDPLARSARQLRAIISGARLSQGRQVRSVALVGLDAAAETSILAANLGVACAQAGRRTLLVDTNLAHPQQHGLFRLPNRVGLSTLLSTRDPAERAIQNTAVPLLALVAGGPSVPNGPELFDGLRLAQCFDQFVDRYDILLADVANASGDDLSACAGIQAAILVLRRDVSFTADVRNAIDSLGRQGAMILGTVMVE